MPIQILLTLGLLGVLVYASVQRITPRVFTVAFATLVVVGIYFVWMPDDTTIIAQWLGVARGTDLLIYVWILISIFVGVNLHLKIRSARDEITELTRALALAAVQEPEGPTLSPDSETPPSPSAASQSDSVVSPPAGDPDSSEESPE